MEQQLPDIPAQCQAAPEELALDTDGSEFDYVGHNLAFAVQYLFPTKTEVTAAYSYNLKDYSSPTASIGEERRDETQRVNFDLRQEIIKYIYFNVNYQYTKSTSNLDSVDYTGNVVRLTLEFSY